MQDASKPIFVRSFSPRWLAAGILLGALGFGLGYGLAGYGNERSAANPLSPAQLACRTALTEYVAAGRRADVTAAFDGAILSNPAVAARGIRYLADGCRPGALLAAMQLLRDRESPRTFR